MCVYNTYVIILYTTLYDYLFYTYIYICCAITLIFLFVRLLTIKLGRATRSDRSCTTLFLRRFLRRDSVRRS